MGNAVGWALEPRPEAGRDASRATIWIIGGPGVERASWLRFSRLCWTEICWNFRWRTDEKNESSYWKSWKEVHGITKGWPLSDRKDTKGENFRSPPGVVSSFESFVRSWTLEEVAVQKFADWKPELFEHMLKCVTWVSRKLSSPVEGSSIIGWGCVSVGESPQSWVQKLFFRPLNTSALSGNMYELWILQNNRIQCVKSCGWCRNCGFSLMMASSRNNCQVCLLVIEGVHAVLKVFCILTQS